VYRGLPNAFRRPYRAACNWRIPIRTLVLPALCLSQLAPSLLHAQTFGWGGLEGSLELGYEGAKQSTTQKNGAGSNFNSDLFRERLYLRSKRLYLVDPRLIKLKLGVGIGFYQDKNDFSGGNTSQDGRIDDYTMDTTIFSTKPLSMMFYASQTESLVTRNFGTRTDISTTRKGARATLSEQSILKDMGFPFFSSSLDVSRVKVEENSSGNGQDFRRKEVHDVLQYDAFKGFQTADLRLSYRIEDILDTERVDNGFITHTANLNYGLDFGPTLNRRWTSINTYISRTGLNSNDSFSANQNLLVHHNVNLSTNYQYTFSQFDSEIGMSTMHSANFAVNHRLYRNLSSSLNVQGNSAELPEGTTKGYGAGPTFNYRRSISEQGHLSLRASANYRINENDLTADTIRVNNEFHQVDTDFPLGDTGFLLAELFVVTESIVIVDRRGGSQLAITAGIDYEVIVEGDRTRIRPLPTSVILQANDPLEVSYQHAVAPSLKYATKSLGLRAGVDFGWLAFSVSHSVSNQSLLSGIDNDLLQDTTTNAADLRVRGTWQRLQFSADAGYRSENSSRQQYDTWRFGQSVTLAGSYALTLTANASESFTSFSQPRPRDITSYAGNLALDGVLARAWRTRIFAGILILKDPDIEDQTTIHAGIRVKRNIGRLTISGDLSWNEFDRQSVTSTGRLIGVHAIRRF